MVLAYLPLQLLRLVNDIYISFKYQVVLGLDIPIPLLNNSVY